MKIISLFESRFLKAIWSGVFYKTGIIAHRKIAVISLKFHLRLEYHTEEKDNFISKTASRLSFLYSMCLNFKTLISVVNQLVREFTRAVNPDQVTDKRVQLLVS